METFKPSIITASDLASGRVVYLADNHAWVDEITDAQIAKTPLELSELAAVAADQSLVVVEPYAVAVRLAADGAPDPLELRERRRARGPSIGYFQRIEPTVTERAA